MVAAITAAESGKPVTLYEAHAALAGRAATSSGPYRANLGPHVLYSDGPAWSWLQERQLVDDGFAPRAPMSALSAIRFRRESELRRLPPRDLLKALAARRLKAPVDVAFRDWAAERWGPGTETLLSRFAGVFSFDADPGRLSAAFVWDRILRVSKPQVPAARYITGGWASLVARLVDRAGSLGVQIVSDSPVDSLDGIRPVIVATELSAARKLLADDGLRWEGANVTLLDVGLESRRGDPFVVSDLDRPGWVERFSACDVTLAPSGHGLVQVQVGSRPGETLESGVAAAEDLLDCGFPDWRERERWRRRSQLRGRSGALDLPGTTWRDRPAVSRGDGIYLAGDMVAADGLLSEVSFASGVAAGRLAAGAAEPRFLSDCAAV